MPCTVVVGAQWGDEGKGKIVDALSQEADVVARYQGGPNAGHSVIRDGQTVVLHLVPSGVMVPGKRCLSAMAWWWTSPACARRPSDSRPWGSRCASGSA